MDKIDNDKFPCTKCGLCCKNIAAVNELKQYHLGDGVCSNYHEDRSCIIYEKRPLVCRIDEGFEKFKVLFKSKNEYYQANAKVCNELQEKNNYDLLYRVRL